MKTRSLVKLLVTSAALPVLVLLGVYNLLMAGATRETSIRLWRAEGRTEDVGEDATSSPVEWNKNYVLTLGLSGQQGSGVRSLSVFQCVLSSIHKGFYIAELSINRSHLQIATGKADDGLKFSSLFDVDYFNKVSRSIGYPEMIKMSEFLEHSPNYTIYVHIRRVRVKPKNRLMVWDSKTSSSKNKCLGLWDLYRLREYMIIAYEANHTLGHLKPRTCIVRIVELLVCDYNNCDKSWTQTVEAAKNFIFGEWSPHQVSLVFNNWDNKLFLPVYSPLNGIHCMERYAQNETKTQFRPSTRLLIDAEKYIRQYLGEKNKLSIMLRVERVEKQYLKESSENSKQSGDRSIKGCLDKVIALKKKEGITHPFVAMDSGKFGTKSAHNDLAEKLLLLSKYVFTSLYDHKLSIEEWEDSFVEITGGVTDPGYIAALQRTIASRADCLALVGGGSFQSLAVIDYIKYHKGITGWKPCVHLICVMTTSNTEVQKTLKNYL